MSSGSRSCDGQPFGLTYRRGRWSLVIKSTKVRLGPSKVWILVLSTDSDTEFLEGRILAMYNRFGLPSRLPNLSLQLRNLTLAVEGKTPRCVIGHRAQVGPAVP